MKNLKKIFIVLALLALTVSSVAVIALADEAYTGSIEEAEAMLELVDDEASSADKSAKLVEVYNYISENNLSLAPGYDEFEKKMHSKSLEILIGMTDGIFKNADSTYYEYIIALQAVSELDKYPEITYSPVNNGIYTGELAVAEAKLGTISDNTSYEAILATMAEVYSYMVANPINPMTDGYPEFIAKYNECAEKFAVRFEEAVDAAIYLDDKIEIMLAVRTTLAGGTPISAKLVDAFNRVRDEIIEEYVDEKVAIENIDTLEAIPTVDLVTDLTEFEGLLATLESSASDFANAARAAAEYLAANNIDPAAEGYTEAISKYNAEIDAYSAEQVNALVSCTTRIGKIDIITAWYNDLKDVPFSENAVKAYNDAREELIAFLQSFIDTVKGYKNKMPVYVAPVEKDATATVESLNYALSDVQGAYNKYVAASQENKASALEEMKSGMGAMYRYLTAAVIDTEAPGYSEFAAQYATLKSNFVTAMLESADEETDFDELNAYFAKNPLSKAAIDSYNEKVDEFFTDNSQKAAAYKVDCIYYATDEIFGAIDATDDRDTVYEGFKELYAYKLKKHDVTDEAYYDFLEKYNEAAEKVEGIIANSFTSAEISDREAALAAAHSLLTAAPFSEDAVKLLADEVSECVNEFNESISALNGESPAAPILADGYAVIDGFMEQYRVAEGIEDKMSAFKALYDKVTELNGSYIKSIDPSYDAFTASYREVCGDFESAVRNYLTEQLGATPYQKRVVLEEVNGYLSDVKFSQSLVDFYNGKLQEVKETDFGIDKAKAESSIPAIDYVVSDKLNENLDEVKALVAAALNGDAVKFKEAYDHIVALTKPYDFGSSEYEQLIINFKTAKNTVTENKVSGVDNAADLSEKTEKIRDLYEYINSLSGTASSLSMVNAYNESRAGVYSGFVEAAKQKLTPFKESLDVIENHYKSCPITNVDEAAVATLEDFLQDFEAKLSAMRGAVARDYVNDFYNISGGKYSAIYQNQAIDNLNDYLSEHPVNENYGDQALAEIIYKEAFERILDEIDALEGEEEEAAIEGMKEYLGVSPFPTALVDLFKARFGIEDDIQNPQYSGETENGTMAGFGTLVMEFYKQESLSDMRDAFSEIIAYVNANTLNTRDTAIDEIERAKQTLDDITAALKAELNSGAPLTEFSYGYVKDNKNKNVNLNMDSARYPTNSRVKLVKANNNGYSRFYDGTSSNRYFDMPLTNKNAQSIVIEFDVMSDKEHKLSFILKTYCDADNLKDEKGAPKKVTTTLVHFKNDELQYGDKAELGSESEYTYPEYNAANGDPKIVAVPGQWMHIVCVIDVENQEQELIVDYVSLGRRKLAAFDGNESDTCNYNNLRLNEIKETESVCYDNLKIYYGTSYREIDKFQGYKDADYFKYYVDYCVNPDNDINNRMFAYAEAIRLKPKVEISVPGSYTQRLQNLDYLKELYTPAEDAYFSHIEDAIDKIIETGITTKNVAEQQKALDMVEYYIDKNGDYYADTSSERLVLIEESIRDLKARILKISNITDLIRSFVSFNRATTSVSMQKYYEYAKNYYQLCEFDDVNNYESAMKDTKLREILGSADDGYRDIEKYCYEYMPLRIEAQKRVENSQKIIDCVSFIETVATGKDTLSQSEYYARLKAKALENVDFVNTYMVVIRDIVDAGSYDPDYEGLDEALDIYNLLNESFYDILMEAHYKVIMEQLAKYPETEAYIGRAGICKYVENYIEANKVDMNSENGRKCLYILSAYKEELELYREDYVAVLEANTVAFIGVVNTMNSYTTYTELKPLYDEAIEKYYYNMNIDSPDAQVAIAQFEAHEAKIKKIEEDSAMFIGYAKTLSTATRKSHVYRAIVNCGMHVDGVDKSIAGVTAALSTYEKKLAAYNEQISAINEDVSSTVDIALSVRCNSIAATVLAVVKSLFGK